MTYAIYLELQRQSHQGASYLFSLAFLVFKHVRAKTECLEDISKFKVKLFTYNYRDAGGFVNVMLQKLHNFLLQMLRRRHYIFYSWGPNSTAFQLGTWGSSCSIWWHSNEAEECRCLLCICYSSLPIPGRDTARGLLTKNTSEREALQISLKDNDSQKPRVISQVNNKKVFGVRNLGFSFSQREDMGLSFTPEWGNSHDSLPKAAALEKELSQQSREWEVTSLAGLY